MYIVKTKEDNRQVFNNVYGKNNENALDLSGNLYMDINALILSAEEHEEILEAQGDVVKLFEDMQRIIRLKPELLEWLGIPEILWDDVIKESISNLTSYGRFDWMFDKEGILQLLEFNSETPFGWKEAIDYHERLHSYYRDYRNLNGCIKELLPISVYKSLREQGFHVCDRIGIIGDLMDKEEIDTYDVLQRVIGYECEEVLVDSIMNLKAMDNQVFIERGDSLYPIDFLQTFYSCEWMAYDEGGADFVSALRSGSLKLINPTSTLILHSKGLFALIWYLYSEEAMLKVHGDTIENYIPYTTFIEDEFKDSQKFVAKPLNHREGSGVEIRHRITGIEDESLIYQEYVDSCEIEYPISNGSFSRRDEMLKPTIGTYLINNEFGGYFTRLSKEVCSSNFSVFVPTFIK
ncbi:MAG: glutathionylspermidine synthase family protein [Clostridium sp.]